VIDTFRQHLSATKSYEVLPFHFYHSLHFSIVFDVYFDDQKSDLTPASSSTLAKLIIK